MKSSPHTCKGTPSASSCGVGSTTAVANTLVRPTDTRHEPCASLASLPVSNIHCLPDTLHCCWNTPCCNFVGLSSLLLVLLLLGSVAVVLQVLVVWYACICKWLHRKYFKELSHAGFQYRGHLAPTGCKRSSCWQAAVGLVVNSPNLPWTGSARGGGSVHVGMKFEPLCCPLAHHWRTTAGSQSAAGDARRYADCPWNPLWCPNAHQETC